MKNNYLFTFLIGLIFLSGSLFAQESTATYRVTFDAQWSRTTHPYQFPFNPRWSPPVGFTHDSSATPLFEVGTVATQGVVNVSQTGSRDPINDEIDALIGSGVEYRVNSEIRVRPSPDSISFTFDISESHPYLSLISMIAPSPDWFVGFNGLRLFENGEWTESTRVAFKPYDSGSDSGVTFESPNQNTSPRGTIFEIIDGPIFGAGEASLGTWIVERIDDDSNCNVAGGSIEGGPFRFCVGDGDADNIGADEITLSGASGANNQWVVTDENGYIQGLPGNFTGPNFDIQGTGVCFVSHLSFEDGLEGLEPGANINDLVGCFNFSNSIYVDRQEDDETCQPNETASYRVIFDAAWSAVTHPVDFPADEPNIARWSPPVGMTHNADTRFFIDGAQATPGVVNMSQTGSRDPINDEIDQVIAEGGAEFRVNSDIRVRPSPDTISFTFDISSSHPRLSLVSMIAPSPDWFIALRDLQLFNDGEWIESQLVDFKLYDSGSDSGTSFASPNFDTQPRTGIEPLVDGPLFANGNENSTGMWRIERIDAGSTCDVNGGSLTGGPFTFCVDGNADNIPANAISVDGVSGSNSQWVVTDASGNILGLPASFTGPDFDAAGLGLCFVYHLAFEDGLTGLEMGASIHDLDGCFNLSNGIYVNRINCASESIVGAVYAMTNGEGQIEGNVQGPNSIVAYGQAADGTLAELGVYSTGGNGGDFDGGEGLDPLISAYAITKTLDNRFVLAVNAGSNTVTSLKVNPDFSLSVVDTESTEDIGPNSVAVAPSSEAGVNGLVYVSNITRPEFLEQGEPAQQGSIIGYRLMDDGSLEPVEGSQRDLANRPSAVQFSPNGDFLVVASINAGASALASGSEDEIVVYAVNADGTLSANQTDGATSTLRGNTEGRNLPSAIGFQIVGDNYVVVTEAREFRPDGLPPIFPALQDGSVSTWQIQADGTLTPISLDVASGENNTGRTACWLDFSDENTFFVSNAIEAGLASYSFDNGVVELIDQVAAQGTGATGNTTDPAAAFGTTEGWIDLWISDDGQYLYQCYGLTGEVGVFAINGSELTLIQEIGGLPQNNVQGIVSVGMPLDGGTGTVAGVDLDLNIEVDNRLYNIYEEVAYTITLTNNGTETATDVIVDASYPNGTVFTSASVTNGNFDAYLEELTVASLAPGQTATLDLVLFTLIENVNITNVVTVVGSGQPDTDFTNNSDFVTIAPFSNGGVATGIGSVDLELSISTDGDSFSQFENVAYNITLTNNGADAATNIFVNAGIPQGLAFTSASATSGVYSYFTENWNIDQLAAGESATLTLTLFTLLDNTSLANYIQVFAVDQNDVDSTPGNNPGNTPTEDDEAVSIINTNNTLASDEVSLRSIGTDIHMNGMYPNPTSSQITLNFEAKANFDAEVRILDVTGRVMSSYGLAIQEGNNQMSMDVSSMNPGVYFIEMTDQNGEVENHKFIKVN